MVKDNFFTCTTNGLSILRANKKMFYHMWFGILNLQRFCILNRGCCSSCKQGDLEWIQVTENNERPGDDGTLPLYHCFQAFTSGSTVEHMIGVGLGAMGSTGFTKLLSLLFF